MSTVKKYEQLLKDGTLEMPKASGLKKSLQEAIKQSQEKTPSDKEFRKAAAELGLKNLKSDSFRKVFEKIKDDDEIRKAGKELGIKDLDPDLFANALAKAKMQEYRLRTEEKDIDEIDEEFLAEKFQEKLKGLELKDDSKDKAINEIKKEIKKSPPKKAWDRFVRTIDPSRLAQVIVKCIFKKLRENSALKEMFRSAFIAYMEAVNDSVFGGRSRELIALLIKNVDNLDNLQSIVTGFKLTTPVTETLRPAPIDELVHTLFDSADEEQLVLGLIEVFPDIVSFLQGFNPIDILEKVEKLEPNGLTDINLDKFISFPFNPKQNDIRKLAKETDKILEEVLYGSLVASAEALIGLLESCDLGTEDLYKVPDVAEFRQASSNGDEIYKIAREANELYDRESFCDFLKYAEGPVTEFIPSEYHEIVREVYDNQDYSFCDDFERSGRFRSPCLEDPKAAKELRELLKVLRGPDVNFDVSSLNELLDEESYEYLTDFTKDQINLLSSRLTTILNSQFVYLIDRSGGPEAQLTGVSKDLYEDYARRVFRTNDYINVDKELKKQVDSAKELFNKKEIKRRSYAELFGTGFEVSQRSGPSINFSGEKLNYKGLLNIPVQIDGFLTDKKFTIETRGTVDYSLIKYEKTGQKAIGYVVEGLVARLLEDKDEVESCREYSVTIDPKDLGPYAFDRDGKELERPDYFRAFGGFIEARIIEITRENDIVEVYLANLTGNNGKTHSMLYPFPLHEGRERFRKYIFHIDKDDLNTHGKFAVLYKEDGGFDELYARNYFKELLFDELSGKSSSEIFGEPKTTSVNADGNYQYYTLDNGVKKLEEFDDSYHDLIYGNIFKTFWEIVRDSPLAKRTKLDGARSVPNASLLELGLESICEGKQLADFGDIATFLPRAQVIGPQQVDENSVAIKSFLKLSAISYILSAPFSYSVSEPNRKLYRIAAPLYVHALRDSEVNDEIKEEVEKNCKAYEDLFVEYCFTAHSGFRGNFNTPSFKFIPKVKRQGDSWFYRTEDSPDAYQQWVLDNYHRDLPFFIGESLVIKEIKRPENKKLYGALPDLVGKRINSEILLEKLKENTPKADKLSDHYEFIIQSELLFHAPLSYTNELYVNSRRSSAWDNFEGEKETFKATVQRDFRYQTTIVYRTKGDAFGVGSFESGGGSGAEAVGAKLTVKYRSQVEGKRGEVESFNFRFDDEKYKSITEINNAGKKTLLYRSDLGQKNFRNFDEFFKTFKEQARGGITENDQGQFRKYTFVKIEIKETVFPLATKSLKLNIEKLSDIVKITPEKTVSYTEKDLGQDSEGVWKCVDVIRTRKTPKKVEYVFDVDQCFEKLQGLIEETNKYKQIKKYFDDPLLFSFVITDEVVYNTEFTDILSSYKKVKDNIGAFLEKRYEDLSEEDYGFDLAKLIVDTAISIVKAPIEQFDPNISLAVKIRDFAVGSLQTGLDIGLGLAGFDDVPRIDYPVTPISLALMANGLFPTPFGFLYLGIEATGLLFDFFTSLEDHKDKLPIRNPRDC